EENRRGTGGEQEKIGRSRARVEENKSWSREEHEGYKEYIGFDFAQPPGRCLSGVEGNEERKYTGCKNKSMIPVLKSEKRGYPQLWMPSFFYL
ncbi:MAG: hypothetical protein LWX70_13050, partial [Sphingobacteriia bacterium]|nr:hypothetical protein [Sphingobacteriia bacterium]